MNMVEIILKKRDGQRLSREEIKFFVNGYVRGDVADYQASALLMTFYFNGLCVEEIFDLTDVMMHSGMVLDLSNIQGIKVDKHSSGGVGDKITLIVGPIAAAAGVKVAKMSGRGLGFTGGTIDKLQAIPGFNTQLSIKEFEDIVNEIGICVTGQTEDIAKADKLIYALRDVTGTVDIIGLIASSIMSKKLALGSDAILLDVKYGDGALMKTELEAKTLGDIMKKIGENAGKKVEVILSPMEQPLGNMVGNANEVIEAIETLKSQGPEDLTNLALEIAGHMIYMGEKATSYEEGVRIAKELIENGQALEKFKEFVKAQGGDENIVVNYNLMPRPEYMKVLMGSDIGITDKCTITKLKASIVGEASLLSGAGRERKDDKIDSSAGITLCKKEGDIVLEHDTVAKIYGDDNEKIENAIEKLKGAYEYERLY